MKKADKKEEGKMEEKKIKVSENAKEKLCRTEGKCDTEKCTLPEEYFEVTPAADIADDESGAELILEVPGANASTVNVEVKDHILSITAASTLCRRTVPVVYKRDFRLSDAVEVTKIKAVTKDGLLTITLPKSERAKVHHIQLK